MLVRKLKELYNVDTISQDKGWKKVLQAINDILATTNEDILIDFSSTNVVDPWQSIEFKKLLSNEKIHMKFVNSEQTVNKIKMMCIIEGMSADRITNEVIEVPREKTAEEKKIEQYGSQLMDFFKDNGTGTLVFNVRDRYDQLQSTNTVNYIDFAMRELHKTKGTTNFIIIFNKISVLPNVLRVFAQLIVDYKEIGVDLKIDMDNDDSARELGLFIHIATNDKYTDSERAKAFNELKPNTPGILIRYKKSKATDDFGRQGKGEVVSSRIAIFREVKDNGDEPIAVVATYNNNYFYTKQHWMVEHDNEEPTSLHEDIMEIPMSDIGLCDRFLGSRTHFILPVQRSKEESQTVIVDIDENDRNIKKICTIPERMKIVFDDWSVPYDHEALDKAISDTNALLSNM